MKSWRSLLLATVMVGALLAMGLYWRATHEPTVMETATPIATPSPVKESGSPAAESSQVAPFLDISAPARALSAPGPIEDLAARAGAGDAIAACQLAAELGECRSKEVLRQFAPDSDEHLPTPRCEALLARHRDKHFEWLRQAAHAGEPEAMLRYAQGEGFGISGASFDYLRSPNFDTWRREAPAMLQGLIEAGYPEALLVRMMANDALMGGPMAGLLPPDRVTDQAYYELFILLQDDPTLTAMMREQTRSRIPGAIREEAQGLAMRWHQDHFSGRTYDFSEDDQTHAFTLMQEGGKTCSVAAGEARP